MELEDFLATIDTDFPLEFDVTNHLFLIYNSGRRGDPKAFYMPLKNILNAFNTIRNNISSFSSSYIEATWRNTEQLFDDNEIKSLLGVQTRPFFETINKIITWANNGKYKDGEMILTEEAINKVLEIFATKENVISYINVPLLGVPENEEHACAYLAEQLNKYRELGSYGVHLFGLQYGKAFTELNISSNEIVQDSSMTDTNYGREVNKGRQIGDLLIQKYGENNFPTQIVISENNDNTQLDNNLIDDDPTIFHDPKQIIYYGVPGSGKSYAIDEIKKELEKQPAINNVKYTRRVVFHPEYTNADFIGQILPEMKSDGIHYNFIPGHFTKILKDAYRNPSKKFALIIEEINRGNAAAIFGDVFQLLDRLTGSETEYSANEQFTYSCGWSKYGIDNTDIIYEIFKGKNGKFEPLCLKYGEDILHINYNTAIRLPPNLSIYATMNTSDQNVFTLDNAFQRRWDMQLVKNECNDSKQMNSKITVKDKYITWKDFQEQINKVIGEKSNESGLSSMEDKRLGCWFVKAEKESISAEIFANKVLKYLWDDAFKFYHTEIFKEGIKNFEDLQKKFLEIGFDVFSDVCELQDKIQSISGSTTSNSVDAE